VVTLIAWGLLGFLLRDPLYVAYDYLRHPIFQLTTAEPLDVGILWWRLRYFWMISAGLIAWLSLWAAIDRRRLRASLSYPQPPPLTIGEQAARDGLDEESVREAQTFKVTNVRFNEDESIAGFEPVIRTRTAGAMFDAAPSQPNA
jgi:hypothetical protein